MSDLERIIGEEIRERGPIPFSRYMELCLYHPRWGYYQRQEPATGPGGDFFTAPHVHALFGSTIAQWIARAAVESGFGRTTVLELGPGNGQLAQDILDHWEDPQLPLDLILVEEAGPRRMDLEARFAGRPVRVMAPSELEGLPPFEGVVLANEFFDALPLRVFRREDGTLEELYVATGEGGFTETWMPAEPEGPMGEIMDALPEGYRAEGSDLWREWLRRIARLLGRGHVLVLDYGDLMDGLVVPWRMAGTLRCYRRHQVDADPFELPGQKDITAHVNFTLLERFGKDEGFVTRSFASQSSFLIRGGLLEALAGRMEALPERDATGLWLTVKNLIHEDGMGEIFKVMVLEKEKG